MTPLLDSIYRDKRLNVVSFSEIAGPSIHMFTHKTYLYYTESGESIIGLSNDGQDMGYTYCLPWRPKDVLSGSLPMHTPNNTLFITANLSGCSMSLSTRSDNIIVKHWNRIPTNAEFRGEQRWIHASYSYELHKKENPKITHKFEADNNVTSSYDGIARFWGEFDMLRGEWIFYVQKITGTGARVYEVVLAGGDREVTHMLKKYPQVDEVRYGCCSCC